MPGLGKILENRVESEEPGHRLPIHRPPRRTLSSVVICSESLRESIVLISLSPQAPRGPDFRFSNAKRFIPSVDRTMGGSEKGWTGLTAADRNENTRIGEMR